ncbi:High mobility group protein DSP1 [Portunus trituberculatus]|uniref:High mobility group protein DSP1 n=1 Tax=Portunus trituberculatus TaxID=210409 RepID=A0A5B7DQ27_PORTR|nr:High mobility group protein DSP1 [Portunus trituberculatus]
MPRGRPKGSGMAVDKPRGRLSAYAFFVQTCRTEHKKLHPDENVQLAEFSRQCSERWKTMSEAEKKKFHDLADQDKIRYNAQMRDFVPPGGLVGRRGRRSRGNKPPKDPNKPKRALSAFFYYANDERAKVRAANPDFSVGEVAKELGRQWNELTENDKLKYEKLAEEDRARRSFGPWAAGPSNAANRRYCLRGAIGPAHAGFLTESAIPNLHAILNR